MATFNIQLNDVEVEAWFPPEEPIAESLIEGGEGTYTISIFGTSIGYYLSVKNGKRVNPLRLGQAVRAKGRDADGKIITTEILETTGIGEPVLFKGPYHQALNTAVTASSQYKSFGAMAGTGAQFWGYISPSNETAKHVTQWQITLKHSNWTGEIDSVNPRKILKTPGLSGIFDVVVEASGPNMPKKILTPQKGSPADIGANLNCSSMIGIVSNADGTDANYWTTWDALCNPNV